MTQSPIDIVTSFYKAINTADADAIGSAVDTWFDDEVSIEWPPSLPHGGRVSGVRKLRGLFTAIARPGSPAPGPTNLVLVRAIGSGDDVVAWITFDWADPASGTSVPNSALELWSFAGGKVREIRAYYWDHAAIAQPHHA